MFLSSRFRTFRIPAVVQNAGGRLLPFLLRATCSSSSSSSFGQPHPCSHPHLFGSLLDDDKREEVTPGVSLSEYTTRRHRLIEKVLAYSKSRQRLDPSFANVTSHLIVIPSSRRSYMVEKIPYFFRQDSDFRYFTGCLEPDCVLVLDVEESSSKSMLFTREQPKHEARWEGARTSCADAKEFFGVDACENLTQFEYFLANYREMHSQNPFSCWYDLYAKDKLFPSMIHDTMTMNMRWSDKDSLKLENPRQLMHQIRCVKSAAEIEVMSKSCQIAATAIKETISKSRELEFEYEYAATVDYLVKMKGAQHLAYPSVVATGDNNNVIHYKNKKV